MKDIENDIGLFGAIKSGDQKAFEILFKKYYNKLCNYAYLYLRDRPKSEEIVSDVYMRIWENKDKIEVNTSLKSYIYRCTRNAVISSVRGTKSLDIFLQEEDKNIVKFVDSPETLLIKREVVEVYQQMMNQLPKQAGLVFRLHKMDGLSYKQIAEVLDLSVKTVENHMGRALRMMRDMYNEIPDFFTE
ncbi:MAG: RNA polymerase sigma-70 factor [Bacteroidota bacterium]